MHIVRGLLNEKWKSTPSVVSLGFMKVQHIWEQDKHKLTFLRCSLYR